jgi:prenylcysteine oxidase / farnesylcysteine lyase
VCDQIDNLFSHDIIQAATRVNYASNLAYIHGLEAMVSMAPDNAMAVVGGNWQIFDRMVTRSNATLHRNTSVTAIDLDPLEDPVYPHTKYILTTKAAEGETSTEEAYPVHFDNVVIASPWQYSDIKASDQVLEHAIDEIPYTKLHVTLFTSPFRLSSEFFGLSPGARTPTVVLTTLNQEDEPKPGEAGVGKAGFYSISTLRTITNPNTLKDEYLYKIFSPGAVTPEFLSTLLGVAVPETFVRLPSADPTDAESAMVDPVSWYFPHLFNSYPIEYPRVTFQDPILGGGLYYTSGIESFVSTMETSGLMGMNVARLIVDDFSQLRQNGGEDTREQIIQEEDRVQNVLGENQIAKPSDENATVDVGEL